MATTINRKNSPAPDARQTIDQVNASIGLRKLLRQDENDEPQDQHSDASLNDDASLDGGILALLDEEISFSNPWEMAAALPELSKFDDSVLNEDESSSDYDPRPTIPEVTEEDWPPEMFPIIEVLKRMVRQAINVNTKPGPREKALRWVFQPDLPGPHGLDFMSACQVLGARPYVVQARVQHQLWVSNIPLRKPLPDGAVKLPRTIESEIKVRIGKEALFAAKMIWEWPGIRADILFDQLICFYLDRKILDRVMSNLEENGYIACSTGFWYFTSRNFSTMTAAYRRRFSWGPSFFGEE